MPRPNPVPRAVCAPHQKSAPPTVCTCRPVSAPRARTEAARPGADDGSLVTEYGLVAVLGATVAGIAIKWASGGAIFELLGSLLTKVKVLVGA